MRSSPVDPTWSGERSADGRWHLLCPGCTRRHARDIEARLPDRWW